ncbi:MAG: hypothetical protein MZV70_17145 [Desulfobacterales bacterium]|nr:hypothetical protein [Desulfobacterales bacterium]
MCTLTLQAGRDEARTSARSGCSTRRTTFERIILQCLERGTLQNQLFDDPSSKTQAFMRGVLGGFLRLPPVKQALMSETLRSRFLSVMKRGASVAGQGPLHPDVARGCRPSPSAG